MNNSRPSVSIGLPVYNGERYLEQCIDSLLSQTFNRLELIISDNGSTDRTQAICEDFAARDKRIRYYRNKSNLGAAWNFNRVFQLSHGKYFKWAAHDDLCAPTYLAKCIEVLEKDASVILCHSLHIAIDEHGGLFRTYNPKPILAAPDAYRRFYECICIPHPWVHVFGVMRTDVLNETRLIGSYAGSDNILLGELSLRGRLYEVPECLFYNRKHPQQSYAIYKSMQAYHAWFDPAKATCRSFPNWRLLLEHGRSIRRVPLNAIDRARCLVVLITWTGLRWRQLARDLKHALRQRPK